MVITYLFGNGFDIQCGLKSRYSDFLKEYTVPRTGDSDSITEFKAYLLRAANQELWSDAEVAMGVHLKDYSDINVRDFVDRMADFELKMIDYLEAQQNQCVWDRKADVSRVFTDFLLNSYKDVLAMKANEIALENRRERNTYQFISFNYTNLLENIIKCVRSVEGGTNSFNHRQFGQAVYSDVLGHIYHVHGELASSIIMGVNDESQLSMDYGLTLTDDLKRLLIKPEMSNAINHSWDVPAKRALRESDVIAIYGVSFGATDQLWWEEIREWLEENQWNKIIAFVRDERPDAERISNFRLVWQIAEYEGERRREILHKLGYSRNHPKYEQLLKQVYIVVNTARLNLQPIILGGTQTEAAAVTELDPKPLAAV